MVPTEDGGGERGDGQSNATGLAGGTHQVADYAEPVSVIAAFSISPMGGSAVTEDGSVGPAVAEVVRIVRESGLSNETNAMFTNVEGSLEEVLALIKRCIEHVAAVAPRVSVVVKLDVRPGRETTMHDKVASVERLLSSP
jgi:uncharacterized protein (TIGR00106 family)